MVGIFKGSTPVNPSKGSSALKEVYVGAVKVWPTAPPYPWLEFIGSKAVAVTGESATEVYASSSGITAGPLTGNAVSVNTFGISHAFPMGGTRANVDGWFQTAILLRPNGISRTDAEAFRGTASQSNDGIFVRVGVQLADADYIDGVFFRFSATGALNFTTDAGLTVFRTNLGEYLVRLPAGKRLAAPSSVILTVQGTGFVQPCVSLSNAQQTEFQISTVNTGFTAVDTSIAAYVAMVNI